MMFLTEEELQEIEAQLGKDWRNRIQQLQENALKGAQLETDLYNHLQKILYHPEAREHLVKALRSAEIPLDVPQMPWTDEISRLKKEFRSFKERVEEEKLKERVFRKLQEYGITEDEYDELIKFQEENKIADAIKAIELYAKFKRAKNLMAERELAPTKGVVFEIPKDYTEEDAYRLAFQEIEKLQRRLGR